MLRLCVFGKDTIDNEGVENVALLQAFGKFSYWLLAIAKCIYIEFFHDKVHHIIVYLYQQHDSGFYIAFEVDVIEVPKSIIELPGFTLKLDDIKRLINLYEHFCTTKKDNTNSPKRRLPSPEIADMDTMMNTRKPKKIKTCLEF